MFDLSVRGATRRVAALLDSSNDGARCGKRGQRGNDGPVDAEDIRRRGRRAVHKWNAQSRFDLLPSSLAEGATPGSSCSHWNYPSRHSSRWRSSQRNTPDSSRSKSNRSSAALAEKKIADTLLLSFARASSASSRGANTGGFWTRVGLFAAHFHDAAKPSCPMQQSA